MVKLLINEQCKPSLDCVQHVSFSLLLTPASTLHRPFALHLLTSLQLSVLSCFCKYKSLWAQLFFKLSPFIKLYSKIIIIIVLW